MAPTAGAVLTFDRLSDDQRGVAWAVVRCLATAVWVAVAAASVAWAVVAARSASLGVWSLPPLIGMISLAVALEVKSRDLERTPQRPGS